MSIPFDIHQLQCFIAVAEELHFGRAAKRMNLTQPPLSRQIKLLEARLGVQLLERNGREIRLTAAGAAFLGGAHEVIHVAQTSANLAKDAAKGSEGRLSIGFTPVSAYEVLPGLLSGFNKDYPLAELVLHELTTLQQLDALVRNDIEAALLRSPINLFQFDRMLLSVDNLMGVVPANHRLTKKKELELSDFDNEPYIGHDPVHSKYMAGITEQGFRAANIVPKKVISCVEPQAMVALVKAGLGLTIVAGELSRYSADPMVEFRPFKKHTLAPIEIWMVWRKGNRNPTLDWLIRSAHEFIKNRPELKHSAQGIL
ncbi:MAG: LysR substrate-binding domain-containing protein [Burkholderiaceae bacterium]